MNSLVENILKRLFQTRKNDEFVFWNPQTRKSFIDLKRSFKTACKKAGIGNMRFHDLRDNFATAMIENGVDIVTVSKLLGYSDINITVARYCHPSPEHKRLAVEGLLEKKEKLPRPN